MRLLLIRHGHPDYTTDTLTERGRRHAEACAARLAHEGITRLYASTHGRATETAAAIGAAVGLPVLPLAFMREIGWVPMAAAVAGEVAAGHSLLDGGWAERPAYAENVVPPRAAVLAEALDALLWELGYRREGEGYRVVCDNRETVAIVSHAGSGTAALSHLLSLPLPFLFGQTSPDFTSVTEVTLEGEVGALTVPHLSLFNDARHIRGL
ncbi:MAG: histidine phosphatase family protein [Clostridia bacterium]|nr:histidine phosphatase family protein [Clostridia bacterium]